MINQGFKTELSGLKVAIATHVYATGPGQELEDYLKEKTAGLIFIGHPFNFAKEKGSFYKIYRNGVCVKQKRSALFGVPELVTYFKDIFFTLFWAGTSKGKLDLFVGVDPLNALAGIILKKFGKAKKVVFYMIDYAPVRFKNVILNAVYHKIDSFCVNNSDMVWNLSGRMAQEREGKGVTRTSHQLVVPIGVNFNRISRLPVDKINRRQLVYMGHVKRNQGLELIIESLKDILKQVPDAKLMIVGGGDLEAVLKKTVQKEGLSRSVEFKGFVPDHKEVETLLSACAIGLALYEPDPQSLTWYTDPSKPKQYMACGLPVIITDVPWIAQEVKAKGLGLVS
ncbi:MAG: glycosyltransferase, partial [Candidatus Omnitrophica bacterium]|nr:glycosyltransferase [Candidatus Omnitrophota bacterium]